MSHRHSRRKQAHTRAHARTQASAGRVLLISHKSRRRRRALAKCLISQSAGARPAFVRRKFSRPRLASAIAIEPRRRRLPPAGWRPRPRNWLHSRASGRTGERARWMESNELASRRQGSSSSPSSPSSPSLLRPPRCKLAPAPRPGRRPRAQDIWRPAYCSACWRAHSAR